MKRTMSQTRIEPERLLAYGLLAVIGFLGNIYGCPVGFGVTFLFGSVFVVIGVYYGGAVPGGIIAVLSASCTYYIWNHPYAIIIFLCEALWLAYHRSRNKRNIVIIDTAFWLFLGLPLVWLFYYLIMSLGTQATLIIYLKQTINGIFNSLLASIMIHHVPLQKVCPKYFKKAPEVSYATIVFHLTAAFLMVPTLALLLVGNHRELRSLRKLQSSLVFKETHGAKVIIEKWLHDNALAVQTLSSIVSTERLSPGPELQHNLELFTRSSPDFHNSYIADSEANTIAFYPNTNKFDQSTIGLNFRDREYYRQVKSGVDPYISDVFRGRGGVFQPIFTISSPIYVGNEFKGFCLGAINLDRLRIALSYSNHPESDGLTIFDDDNKIVCSTKKEKAPMTSLEKDSGQFISLQNGVQVWTPQTKKNVSVMDIWKDAVYLYQLPLAGTQWTVQAEASVAPLQAYLFHATIVALSLVFAMFILANIVSHWISQLFARIPADLASLSRDLPDKVLSRKQLDWPDTRILEMADLVGNFKHAYATIQHQISQIKSSNTILEKGVADRTMELQTLTEDLEDRIEQEIALRRKGEDFIVQQAKLAAMGEMIGAIAHQWRQPLNALGIIVQNSHELHSMGELDEDQMAASTRRAMDHINFMSRTIDDFRNFFRPDKEASEYDVLVATMEVLSLFAAQLNAADIECTIFWNDQAIPHCESTTDSIDERTVFGFRNEFEHVVLNLLSNAKDAIMEGRNNGEDNWKTGKIRISTSLQNKHILMHFHDNGCGISPDIKNRIFEPYISTKGKMHGTGMGLYMSKVIIEEHMNGTLCCEKVSEGAVFCLELPLIRA